MFFNGKLWKNVVQVLCISAHEQIKTSLVPVYAHILTNGKTKYQPYIFLHWITCTTFYSIACYTCTTFLYQNGIHIFSYKIRRWYKKSWDYINVISWKIMKWHKRFFMGSHEITLKTFHRESWYYANTFSRKSWNAIKAFHGKSLDYINVFIYEILRLHKMRLHKWLFMAIHEITRKIHVFMLLHAFNHEGIHV